MTDLHHFDTVLVVDFGAQYAQLIARRVREAHVYSEIVPPTVTAREIRARRPKAVILSGGPSSVHAERAPRIDPAVFDLDVPVLGICYGQQLMAQTLGGTVERTGSREYGRTLLTVEEPGRLLADLPLEQPVWMSHGDTVTAAPPGFRVTARTPSTPAAAFEYPERGLYGVQFHPEVSHSRHGRDLMKRFLYDAAGCRPTWTPLNVIEHAVTTVREQVGDRPVLCALSGGVDSSVAAALVHRAVGDQLTCVFVDHGLMRHDEGRQVEETFRGHFDVNLVHVKAEDRFLAALAGVSEPEDKRRIIGEQFIRVFEEVARDVHRSGSGAELLVQGTLYPDVIESGSATAATIKSHHNVGGLPERLDLELIEPLRLLFKDEVRVIGEELGLPEPMVWRQPFPGPGLAVRIVGEVTRERLAIVRAADHIVLEELRRAGLMEAPVIARATDGSPAEPAIWQAFAVLLTVRSVGVMGDERTYGHPVVVRAVTSEDAMTADWARLPHDVVERISGRIVGEVEGVNRVVLDVTSKPPGTIEWE
ncbi:MAG TPA: glutamine-hydrolyzing GMP synthase [Nitriliruptorales bacterium]|nr:glutamine-hydrolyzing GMP synthase [Nitriliruptorales bacterium]